MKKVMIGATARTPVGKIGGALSHLSAIEIGGLAVEGAISRAGGLQPDTIVLGNVLQGGNGQNPARQAAIHGGAPRDTTGLTINNVCLSSMSSIAHAKRLILTGEAKTVLVGGFESMSCAPVAKLSKFDKRPMHQGLPELVKNDGLWCSIANVGMGEVSESENLRLSISRFDQDRWSLRSHLAAKNSEKLRIEEMYIGKAALAMVDEGIRLDTSIEKISALLPAFVSSGSITAANSSQMSDAGAAGFVALEDVMRANGVSPMAEICGTAMVAGKNSSLHLMPSQSIKKLLENHNLKTSDIGVWEINEAFAGVVLASIRDLGISEDRVNTLGGAIAIGHPLAASAFRIVMSLISGMKASNHEYGIAAICGGGGQGKAILLRSV